jgi:hypothetical protein
MSRKMKAVVGLGSLYVTMMSYALIPLQPVLFTASFFVSALYAYVNLRGW